MSTWIIGYAHPMYMGIFRIMKTTYHMLDPLNEPPSADETQHTVTLGYTVSQEDPSVLSTLFIHFRLSKEAHTRFTVVFHDIPGINSRIEDEVKDLCIPIPLELVPRMIEVYEFVSVMLLSCTCSVSHHMDDYKVARMLWKRVQAKKFHKRVLPQKPVLNDASESFSQCPICNSDLIHCMTCQVASCGSGGCRGYSQPPLAQCVRHQQILCIPCLEDHGPRLEKCGGCESWCCTRDIFECSGRPVGISPIPRVPGREIISPDAFDIYNDAARAHPPRRDSCINCHMPGWQNCDNPRCWSPAICPECASGGVECLCGELWACNLCANHDDVVMRCPRCDRPFCPSCYYIDRCVGCEGESLCFDCAEEASDVDDGALKPVILVASCGICKEKVCDHCLSYLAASCAGCSCQLCGNCASTKCLTCDRPVCEDCFANHPNCFR